MAPPHPPVATVRVSFAPDPAYVSTVRMVAAAVALEAGVPDELLDEVRLAIGEACTRAVALHRRRGLAEPIDVTMSDGPADRSSPGGRFTVLVTDRGSLEAAQQEQAGGDLVAQVAATRPGDDTGRNGLDEDLLTLGVGLTLLSGLVHDLAVVESATGTGTEVRMSWPVARPGTRDAQRQPGRNA